MKYYLLFIYLLSTSFCFSNEKEEKKDPPNVLLIVIDDLNDYVGFLGGHPQAQTPSMDALASESVIFTNAFTNNPICAPSRASFFSGLYPHTSRNFAFKKFDQNPILTGSKTMMELFMENNYQVLGTGKLMHHFNRKHYHEFGDRSDFGPFPFNGEKSVGHPSVPEPFRSVGTLDGSFARLSDIPKVNNHVGWYDKISHWPKFTVKPFKYNSDEDRDLMPDEVKAEDAIRWLKEMNPQQEKPFFLSVGFNRPHTPLYVPDHYFDRFPLNEIQLPPTDSDISKVYFDTQEKGNAGNKGYEHYSKLLESYEGDKDLALRTYIQAYLACVAFVDDQVGKVLKALEESDFNENTIVILVSDHAYLMGDKNYLYKNALWDKSTRIPMLIREAGRTKSLKVDHPVSLIDIYPTLIEMCDLKGSTIKNEMGKPLDGYSLQPFINEKENDFKGKDYVLTTVTGGMGDIPEKNHFSIRTKEYRYIRYANKREELYDHKVDPYEKNNVAEESQYASIKSTLEKMLEEELKLAN